jgi:hypothetical protein
MAKQIGKKATSTRKRPVDRTTSRLITLRLKNENYLAVEKATEAIGVSRSALMNEIVAAWLAANRNSEPG